MHWFEKYGCHIRKRIFIQNSQNNTWNSELSVGCLLKKYICARIEHPQGLIKGIHIFLSERLQKERVVLNMPSANYVFTDVSAFF